MKDESKSVRRWLCPDTAAQPTSCHCQPLLDLHPGRRLAMFKIISDTNLRCLSSRNVSAIFRRTLAPASRALYSPRRLASTSGPSQHATPKNDASNGDDPASDRQLAIERARAANRNLDLSSVEENAVAPDLVRGTSRHQQLLNIANGGDPSFPPQQPSTAPEAAEADAGDEKKKALGAFEYTIIGCVDSSVRCACVADNE
jgi:hypothetical protein